MATVLALPVGACGAGEDEAEQPPPVTSPPREEARAKTGRQLFKEQGCGACHTLAAANLSSSIGPSLDKHLGKHSKRYIRRSIVDPDADNTHGFKRGLMPDNFGKRLSKQELDRLVDFLADATR